MKTRLIVLTTALAIGYSLWTKGASLPQDLGLEKDWEQVYDFALDWDIKRRPYLENDIKWDATPNLEREAKKKELEEKRKTLETERSTAKPSLQKGEFEKTSEYQARLERAERGRTKEIESKLTEIETDLQRLASEEQQTAKQESERVKNLKTLKLEAEAEAKLFYARKRRFQLPVKMGLYDADKEEISSFTPQMHVLPSKDKAYELLGKISGIGMKPENARKLREASDQDRLWLVVVACSRAPVFDVRSYERDKSPMQIAREEKEKKNEALRGAVKDGLINAASAALGGGAVNKGILDYVDDAKKPVSSTERADRRILSFQFIETATPLKIVIFDDNSKEWKTVWSK